MTLNASLSFLNRNRGKTKQVCRICREIAELKTEGLCAECARVKAQIHLHITQQPADGDSGKQAQQCKRSGCLCAPCGRRILDPHPFQPSDPARVGGREIHFHPRCHFCHRSGIGIDRFTGDDNGRNFIGANDQFRRPRNVHINYVGRPL